MGLGENRGAFSPNPISRYGIDVPTSVVDYGIEIGGIGIGGVGMVIGGMWDLM